MPLTCDVLPPEAAPEPVFVPATPPPPATMLDCPPPPSPRLLPLAPVVPAIERLPLRCVMT